MDLIPEMDGAVSLLRVTAGGSLYNVAVGLARLGLRASYAGLLSTYAFGRLLHVRLADEGVDESGEKATIQDLRGMPHRRWSRSVDGRHRRAYTSLPGDATGLPIERPMRLVASSTLGEGQEAPL